MEKIVIVEDEKPINQVLQAYLKKSGYKVMPVFDGRKAMEVIQQELPDLILLDVMLPGKSGWEILEEVRQVNLAPVIMLTALGETPERLKGFQIGADDYISKPFVGDEVVARVKAVLRRSKQNEQVVQRFGSLEINQLAHEVTLSGKAIELTPRDLSLLLFLAENPNQTFSREQLIEHIWGWDYTGSDRAVDLAVKRIRKALIHWEHDEGEIKTIRGLGYQLRVY